MTCAIICLTLRTWRVISGPSFFASFLSAPFPPFLGILPLRPNHQPLRKFRWGATHKLTFGTDSEKVTCSFFPRDLREEGAGALQPVVTRAATMQTINLSEDKREVRTEPCHTDGVLPCRLLYPADFHLS